MSGNLASLCFAYENVIRMSLIGLHFAEELLIDFHELIGEHSGENLAHAVYKTLETYGLKGWASIFSLIFRALADEFSGCCHQL